MMTNMSLYNNQHNASMVRKLKHHEQKLLKKVDFLDKDRRTIEVMHRYHIQRREDYTKYNKLCGQSMVF